MSDISSDRAKVTRVMSYDQSHRDIVTGGIDKIRAVLGGGDTGQILSLLFCLDYYLDPYYGHRLPYENEVLRLLEETVITSDNDEVIEDCLDLLSSYGSAPFSVLEKNINSVKENMRQEVRNFLSECRWECVYAVTEKVFEHCSELNWKMIPFVQTGGNYVGELKRELGECELSWENIYAAARSETGDDVLFYLPGEVWRIYHLTYSENEREGYPLYREFPDIQAVIDHIRREYAGENL